MSRFFARAIAHKTLGHAKGKGWLDIGYGFSLFKDRRVPVTTKLLAIGLGLVLTVALEILELPLEAVLAALLPFAGLAIDAAVDGVEFVVLPFVFAAIILTRLAPKTLVPVRIQNRR